MKGTTIPDDLFQKYLGVGNVRGGDLLLSHSDALRFIGDCEERGLTIVGMDFYIVDEHTTTGLLNSADFSSLLAQDAAAARSVAAALRILEGGLPDGANRVSFDVEREH